MKKMILAGLLSVGAASAQTTGLHMMDGYGMMGSYGGLFSIFMLLFWVGIFLLIWLWVIKLWKEVRRMK